MEMYSPVTGKIRNDEEVLHRGVRTYYMAKGELEAMLQRQFGKKLEPVRENEHKTLPREGVVIQFHET